MGACSKWSAKMYLWIITKQEILMVTTDYLTIYIADFIHISFIIKIKNWALVSFPLFRLVTKNQWLNSKYQLAHFFSKRVQARLSSSLLKSNNNKSFSSYLVFSDWFLFNSHIQLKRHYCPVFNLLTYCPNSFHFRSDNICNTYTFYNFFVITVVFSKAHKMFKKLEIRFL